MINKLLQILKSKKNRIPVIAILFLILLIGGFFILKKDYSLDPYAILIPRNDGNALILNLKNTSSYDSINYELAYVSKPDVVTKSTPTGEENAAPGGIDRGVVGNIDTKQRRSEYEQEILFGTCSKNVCKYDKGVENGTLTLNLKKGSKLSSIVTQWHLQSIASSSGVLSSGDSHFVYKIVGDKNEFKAADMFTIINDLTGTPKLPEGKKVLGKVYALNIPLGKSLRDGEVTFETAENPPQDAKIARFNEGEEKWEEYETKVEGSKLTAQAKGSGIFAILVKK